MASLVDSRPTASPTPPRDSSQFHARPVDNASSFPDSSPRSYSPPIKTTTHTLPPAPHSAASSPGLDIPGAFFPREREPRAQASDTGSSGQAQRQNITEPSREQPTPPTAIPRHVSGKRTSLPSTEKEGTKPGEHCDGVGPLPGSISETSVAKLPDERSENAGEPDQCDRKPVARPPAVSLPSQERSGVQPYEHHDGVGPLPGTSSEASVAKLPDERKGAPTSEERSGSAASAGSQESARRAVGGIANLGTQVGRVDPQEPVSARKVPERDDQEPEAGAKTRDVPGYSKFKEEVVAQEKKGSPEKKNENHRAAEEPTSPKKDEGAETAVPQREPGSAPTQRKGRSSSDSDASNHKKASVMNRVKGEMKVLLGKASRNKEKVEVGEKLKSGSD